MEDEAMGGESGRYDESEESEDDFGGGWASWVDRERRVAMMGLILL